MQLSSNLLHMFNFTYTVYGRFNFTTKPSHQPVVVLPVSRPVHTIMVAITTHQTNPLHLKLGVHTHKRTSTYTFLYSRTCMHTIHCNVHCGQAHRRHGMPTLTHVLYTIHLE